MVMHGKLKRHISRNHKYVPEVAEALKKDAKLSDKFIDNKRKEGIYAFNTEKMKTDLDESKLMRERKPKYVDSLKLCKLCNRFLSSTSFSRHVCKDGAKAKCTGVAVSNFNKSVHKDPDFQEQIIEKLRATEVGETVRQSEIIQLIGWRSYSINRHDPAKIGEVRKRVMGEMRILSRIFLKFKALVNDDVTIEDMFTRKYLQSLKEAISSMGESDDPNTKAKYGMIISSHNLIIKASKILCGHYAEFLFDEKTKEVEQFINAYNYSSHEVLSESRYIASSVTSQTRRRPELLPTIEQSRTLHNFIHKEITKTSSALRIEFKSSSYRWLRSLTISVLTLYNARRGEEGTRLLMQDYQDALDDVWVPQVNLEELSDENRIMIDKYKMAYVSGKGKRDVSLLIPKTIIEPLQTLYLFRKDFGIKDSNIFFFASKGSPLPTSGWHALSEVGSRAGILINATTNRHFLSTRFASLDIPEADRQVFLDHMGHADRISRENYQAKIGIKTMRVMAPILEQGKLKLFFYISV